MRWLLLAMLAASCSGKPAAPGGGSAHDPSHGTGCADLRGKVEQLYRHEARLREPTRAEQAVADNTSMVMTDCAKQPAVVTACIASVTTVADLEARCLTPLDDEGTEGELSR